MAPPLGSGAAYTVTRLLRVEGMVYLSSMAPPLGSGAPYTVTRLLRVEGLVYLYGSSSGVGSCVHCHTSAAC